MGSLFTTIARPGSRSSIARRAPTGAWLLCACALLFTLVGASPADDALQHEERQRLQQRAGEIEWPVQAARRQRARAHPLGIQTLAIDTVRRKGDEPNAPRRAHVYQYDHDFARSRRLELAIDDTRLLADDPIASVHLPLNQAERDWVAERVSNAIWLQDTLAVPLAELEQSAFVFEPDDPDTRCRTTRCALVSLAHADGTVLVVEAVVEFDTGRVRPLDTALNDRRP